MAKTAPHLEVLDIRQSGHWQFSFRILDEQSVFTDGIPSLKSLHLVGLSSSNIILPGCTATSLQLHQCAFIHSSLPFGTSHSFSSITQLIISEIYTERKEWDTEVIIIPFPSLKALYMRYLVDYDKILSRIVAPELDTLYLESVSVDEMADIIATSQSPESNFSKFPHLRRFTLRLAERRTLSYGLWHAVMEAFQQVTHFTLLDPDVFDFLEGFSTPDASHVPWPMLEMLSLPNVGAGSPAWAYVKSGSLTCVQSAVSTRAHMGYPIRKLQVSPQLFADGASFWWAEGVDVEVVVNPLSALPAVCRVKEWVDWDDAWARKVGLIEGGERIGRGT
ncbi:hypothetical protein FIBSPDRAFT_876318 [Athelia psychrophila]|uniref:F-box domain-containing protein n=1 Tax=Athelia psychrophila TaxID=1759441 RepID=A0A167WZ99_9AGAM|nr:hypothetical protein FIBSPDRAFT_876318 [Fibularhizoctonia sp. CBS 109695]